jgi:hypothetical protein
MRDTTKVQGSAWYIFKHYSAGRRATGHPFDGLDDLPKVKLWCTIGSSQGLRNRFPEDTSPAYLVVTESSIAPEVHESWTVEPAELEDGFRVRTERLRLVRVVATYESRWGTVQECIFAVEGDDSPPVGAPILGRLPA